MQLYSDKQSAVAAATAADDGVPEGTAAKGSYSMRNETNSHAVSPHEAADVSTDLALSCCEGCSLNSTA
jgi:hypothetical protein